MVTGKICRVNLLKIKTLSIMILKKKIFNIYIPNSSTNSFLSFLTFIVFFSLYIQRKS